MHKAALIFPGQGAQFVGMGREFYDASPEAKAIFDQANQIIPGLTEVIFNGPSEKLTETAYCQPAIFAFSMAALKAFQNHASYKNVNVNFACGLSLGELSALCATGAIGFKETLRLVERRASFMDEATKAKKGAMAAVIGFDEKKLLDICKATGAQVANFNSLEQIVITGAAENVAAASQKLQEAGAKRVIPLDVAGAFHSSLMQPAVPKFAAELKGVTIGIPYFPLLSNVDAVPTTNPETIRQNLSLQIISSVQWVKSIETIASHGVTHFIEIGPGTVLKGLIRKINKDLTVANIQKPVDIESLSL